MTDTMTIAVIAGAVLLGSIVLGLLWWVNRPPPSERERGTLDLPLFAANAGGSPSWDDDGELDTKPAATARAAAPRGRDEKLSAMPPGAPKPSNGVPVAGAPSPRRAAQPNAAVTSATDPRGVRSAAAARTAATASAASPRASASGSGTAPGGSSIAAHPPSAAAVSGADVPGSTIDGQSVRFSVPAEGTLQFLPGRLEITAGPDVGREVRFVNLPGPDGIEITFGRSEGPRYRHIELYAATVSRAHARLRLIRGAWTLTNLSQTNPVVLNERTLQHEEDRILVDGDRIEMGEVEFLFRSR